ncbi:MAG: SpoIIE family protein phosphatase [Abitibacteriaceae bacterium]|nr:SpoIIE family protein phosphatase [Abditibacteriaceae bacterium]
MASDRVASETQAAGSAGTPSINLSSNSSPTAASSVAPTAPTNEPAQAMLDSFFSLSLDMLCIAGFDGYFKRLNPAFERTLGYSQAELMAQPFLEWVHPDDRAATLAETQRLSAGNSTVSFENRYRCKDGSYRWLLWNASAHSEQQLIYAAAHDVTRRKQQEEATHRVEEFVTSIVENIPHMIFVKDAHELRFVRINKAEEEMMGRPQSEIIGKNDYDLFPADEAKFFTTKDRGVLAGREVVDIPEETVHTGQGVRIFHTKKIPIFNAAGKPEYLLGISEDITEQKQAEAKMKAAQDEIIRSREELRLRNALMQTDLDLARAMQEAFILKQYPCFPQNATLDTSALCFQHRYIPAAALGGDFFDVLALSDTCAGVFICDVMGHGVRSALVTAMMRALVGEKNSAAAHPGEFLMAINQHLHGILEQAGTPMFASAFYLVADTATGKMRYANAGHPSPARVRRSAGTVDWLLTPDTPSGPALGVFQDAVYETVHCDLSTDDLFVLFTDGVFEVQGAGEEYGQERLIASLRRHANLPPAALFDRLLKEIQEFSACGEFEDDVCLVGMRVAHMGC